ncbi:MAG: hypothetical protein EAY72_09145 [Bacteroidetes bacterium]|nr:MAG: hypothetical protein EAY72_09145 [Bacteroidota bacterium]
MKFLFTILCNVVCLLSVGQKKPWTLDITTTFLSVTTYRTNFYGQQNVQATYNSTGAKIPNVRADLLKYVNNNMSLGLRLGRYVMGVETFFDPTNKQILPPLTHYQGHADYFSILQLGLGTRLNISNLLNTITKDDTKTISRLTVNFQLFSGFNFRTIDLTDYVTQRSSLPFFYPHTVVGANGDIATIDREYENRAKVNLFVSPELLLRFKLTNKFALQASLLKQFNLGNPLFMHYNSFELNGQTLGRQEIVGPHHSSGFTFGISYTFLKNKKQKK